MAGNLDREFGPDHNVAGPVTIFVPPEISGPLGAGVGRALQAQGIKVVLQHSFSYGGSGRVKRDPP